MNGKGGAITYATVSAFIGVLMAWISITQLVIEPLEARLQLARENYLRENLSLHNMISDLERRIRALEQRR